MTKFKTKHLNIIKNKFEEFSIGLDYVDNFVTPYPVFLFIPNNEDFTHYHIPINRKKAEELRDWLDKYLKS